MSTVKTTPYTYLLKFKPTNQVYYGSRTAKGCDPNEFFNFDAKPYTTSSKLVNTLLKQHGPDAFEYEIRKTFNDRTSCLKWETRILKYFNVESNPAFLNSDSKQQSYKAIQNNIPTKFISNIELGVCVRIHKDKPTPVGWIDKNINRSMTSSTKNTIWIHNIATKSTRMIPLDSDIPVGWVRGRPSEYLQSHSKKLKSRNFKHYTDGAVSVLLSEKDVIPEGFYPGRVYNHKPSGKKHHQYMWITDGNENKQLVVGSVMPTGFYPGKTVSDNMIGGNNPSARPVKYNGVLYATLTAAIEDTKLSRFKLLKNGLVYL